MANRGPLQRRIREVQQCLGLPTVQTGADLTLDDQINVPDARLQAQFKVNISAAQRGGCQADPDRFA